jgi:hypothetical protein
VVGEPCHPRRLRCCRGLITSVEVDTYHEPLFRKVLVQTSKSCSILLGKAGSFRPQAGYLEIRPRGQTPAINTLRDFYALLSTVLETRGTSNSDQTTATFDANDPKILPLVLSFWDQKSPDFGPLAALQDRAL